MKTKKNSGKLFTAILCSLFIISNTANSQSPGIECGCDTVGKYGPPQIKEILIEQGSTVTEGHSVNNKYQVEVVPANSPNTVHITVKRNSIPILSEAYRAIGWGFSPDEDKFVIHGSDDVGHMVWLYNLDPNPSIEGEQAVGDRVFGPSDVSSSSISFSPHGKYLLYGAISFQGKLVLKVYNTDQPDSENTAYDDIASPIVGLPSGESVAGWGFSPDTRDRTFAHAILTDADSYTMIVRNLETGEDVLREPELSGTATFRFSPCGDYFLWIWQNNVTDPTCYFYKTSETSENNVIPDEEGSGIDLQFVYTKVDGHYIKYSNGDVEIFDHLSEEECDDKTPPTWPGGASLTADNITGSTVDMSWPAATDSKGSVFYKVMLENSSVRTLEDVTSFQVTDLEPNNTYNFKILAGDESDNWTNDGPSTNISTANNDPPTWTGGYLDSLSATGTSIRLHWGGADDEWGVMLFRINQVDGPSVIVPGDSSRATIRELQPGQPYTFNIEAGDAADQWTPGPDFTVIMPTDNKPKWPTGAFITVTETTETSATFIWNAAVDDFGVLKYKVQQNGIDIDSMRYNVREYTAENLEQGETYTFFVYAGDESGNWSDSLVKDISTMPAFTELALVTETGNQTLPDIQDQNVVWQDTRNGNADIYKYDLESDTEIALTSNTSWQGKPAVSGQRVVWEDARAGSGNTDIYMYDPWHGEVVICNNPGMQVTPHISGTKIVWSDLRNGDYDIYMFDVITLEEKVICSASGRQASPQISGHIVVWEDHRNGDADIYGYNTYTEEEFEVCKEPGNQMSPVVDFRPEYRIIWTDDRNSDLDLYMWTQLVNTPYIVKLDLGNSGNQASPHIADNQLVYMDDQNGTWDIYAYKFYNKYYGDIVPVCLADGDQFYPRTSKGRVVWEDHRNDDGDIYIWDRPPGTDLALTLVEVTDPISVGKTLVYELTASNNGPENEARATVTCQLPVNAILADTSVTKGTLTLTGLSLDWDIGFLPNDSSAVLNIYLKTISTSTLSFGSQISGLGFDPDPSNNEINETTEVKLVVSEPIGSGVNPTIFAENYGKVHVVYGTSDSIVYASKILQGEWNYELLYAEGGIDASDITMDGEGNIHISYSDGRLHHLTNENSGFWKNRIVALSDSGFSSIAMGLNSSNNLHILYQQSSGGADVSPFRYLSKISGVWSYPTMFCLDGYDHIDMVLDNEGYAHSCFFVGGIWPVYQKSNDTIINSWLPQETIQPNWSGGQMEGMVIDIAVDSLNNPHIIYPGSTNNDYTENIKYARKDSLNWHIQQIDVGSAGSASNAIVAEPSGVVHVSYMHLPSGELRYATNIAGTWIKETIGGATDWGEALDMGLDGYGNVHIVYLQSDEIRYALRPPIEYFTVGLDTLDFGSIKIDSSKTIYLTMSNEMTNKIMIDSISILNSSGFSIDKTNFSLLRGIKDSIAVTFSPETEVFVDTYLRIQFISNSKLFMDIPVFARTPAPALEAVPDPVNFGAITIGTQEFRTVTLSNEGDLDLNFSDINVMYWFGGQIIPTNFHLVSHSCTLLQPGESCEVEVDFSPVKTLSQGSYLNIFSNDPVEPYKQVRLFGSGKYPMALISTSVSSIDFGYVDLNQSATEEVWIQSTGDLDLEISSVLLSGTNYDQFTISHSCTTITPGDSCKVEVNYNPTIASDCIATLNINSNYYFNPYPVNLKGSAIYRDLTVSDTDMDFGQKTLGEDSLRIITLTNNESYDITITNTSIVGRDMLEFLHTGCSGTLASGESISDSIWFSPQFQGDKIAILRIESNDSDTGILEIPLTGSADEGVQGLQVSVDANPLTGAAPLDVQFSVSVIGGSPPYSYGWNFADGGSSLEQNPLYTYNTIGSYDVVLYVTDAAATIGSDNINIEVAETVYTLTGEIFDKDGITAINNGLAELYKEGSHNIEQQIVLDGSNTYTFNNIIEGQYCVRFLPDMNQHPDYLPTYTGDVLNLFEATYLNVNSNLAGEDILLVKASGSGSGDGTINGNVVEDGSKGATLISIGASKADAIVVDGIFVFLKNSSTQEIEAYDITDYEGFFKFKNLPEDSYEFLVDYKGLPMDPANPPLVLTQSSDSLNILVSVSTIEISTTILATDIADKLLWHGIKVYPNPTSEFITIEDPENLFEDEITRISLFKLNGNLIISRKELPLNQKGRELSLAGLSEGLYLLRIESKSKSFSTRIVIVR